MKENCKVENILDMLKGFQYEGDSIYLDLGCGSTNIAGIIENELKMKYIGIDKDNNCIDVLKKNGYEAYNFTLEESKANVEFLRQVVNGRKIGCIALINILEYIKNTREFLTSIKELTKDTQIPVVICVSNFGHRDIAFKLLCDKLDETEVGLLNAERVSVFNESKLLSLCAENGLHVVAQNDVKSEKSDQHFPIDLLTLTEEASFSKLLKQLRNGVSDTGNTEQILRLFLSGPHAKNVSYESTKAKPFLSIITRTTGDRIETLKEVFLCLAGQECTDFEVLVMGHNVIEDKQIIIEKAINDTPQWIREKIRFIKVDGGNRSTPLNNGFAAAKGQYISILDDDDIVFGNWVRVFKSLSESNYGRILRSVSVRQEYEPVQTEFSQNTSRAVTGFIKDYPSEFDFLQMLHHNQCPGLCLAFPNSVFREFGLRFDEKLNTIEDWDFIMRAVFICGVASSPDITNIYRWWRKGESSQTLHQQEEWEKNYAYVQNKLDSQYIILPPGNMRRIVHLIDAYNRGGGTTNIESNDEINYKRYIANELLTSNSWKITKPLRIIKWLLGKKTVIPNLFTANEEQLDELIKNIYNSKSWKITACFRHEK